MSNVIFLKAKSQPFEKSCSNWLHAPSYRKDKWGKFTLIEQSPLQCINQNTLIEVTKKTTELQSNHMSQVTQ